MMYDYVITAGPGRMIEKGVLSDMELYDAFDFATSHGYDMQFELQGREEDEN